METKSIVSSVAKIESGFTLIELMVTLSVLAILLAAAVPAFQGMIQRNRLVSSTNDLVSSLMVARSEAIKRGAVVTICKTSNPDAAAPVCAAGANWADGWVVFTDGGTRGTVDGGDVRLKVQQPEGANNPTITPSANFSNAISFSASGAAVSNNTVRDVSVSGSFTLCLAGQSRVVDVALSGRVTTTPGNC